MQSKKIRPAAGFAGECAVPGDKSISHRAVILGALSETPAAVEGFLKAEDCLRTVEAFRMMGVRIEQEGNRLAIHGKGLEGLRPPKAPINCGNSGTTARLLMGVLTGQPFEVALTGDKSLSRRPMDRLIEPLSKMGATFFTAEADGPAHLPLRMLGTHSVRSLTWKSPVASAQVKSAILLAGLYASGTTEVQEPCLSRDHTERMMRAAGVSLETDGSSVRLQGTATVRATKFAVPADLSSAAFLLAAGALLSPQGVTVKQVGINPTRTGIIDILKAMGGKVRMDRATQSGGEPLADLIITKSELKGTEVAGELVPRAIDEFPIIAVLATQARGITRIRDARELRVKESDRISALRQELSKMGAQIAEHPDGMDITGPTPLHGAVVNSHGDHRLAMSLAIAALVADSETTIEDVACVDTSFPTFWKTLESLGNPHE
jgi:3-phosphoshikimate 1-carboxyvinyltransferase